MGRTPRATFRLLLRIGVLAGCGLGLPLDGVFPPDDPATWVAAGSSNGLCSASSGWLNGLGRGLAGRSAWADEVRVVTQGGQQYQETYRVVRQPVSSIQWQQQEVTRYVQQQTSETREWQRVVYQPQVRYEYQQRVRNRWNPLAQPQVVYELVPRTVWERRVERVRQPVVRREWVPEKRLVDVPQRVLGFEERRELVSRVPLGPPRTLAGNPGSSAAGPAGMGVAGVGPAGMVGTGGPPAPFAPGPLGATPLVPPPQVARQVGGIQRYDGTYPARRPAAATELR